VRILRLERYEYLHGYLCLLSTIGNDSETADASVAESRYCFYSGDKTDGLRWHHRQHGDDHQDRPPTINRGSILALGHYRDEH